MALLESKSEQRFKTKRQTYLVTVGKTVHIGFGSSLLSE